MIFYTSQRKCYTFCNTLIHQLHLLVVLQINILYIHSASFDSYFASLHGCFVYVCGSFDVLIALCGHFELMLHLFWATLCFFLHCFVLHCGSFAVFCIFWQIFCIPMYLFCFCIWFFGSSSWSICTLWSFIVSIFFWAVLCHFLSVLCYFAFLLGLSYQLSDHLKSFKGHFISICVCFASQ